jgi:hypothetical protein
VGILAGPDATGHHPNRVIPDQIRVVWSQRHPNRMMTRVPPQPESEKASGPSRCSSQNKEPYMSYEVFRKELNSSRRLMVIGAVLTGIGGLVGCAGILLVSSSIVSATRRWANQLDTPPMEIARIKWQQARAATTAGAQAWRSGPPTQSPSSAVRGRDGRQAQ